MRSRYAASIGERRLVFLLKEVGPNVGTWGREVIDPIREAAEKPNPIRIIMAPVAAAVKALQLPDYLLTGAVDEKVVPVKGSETLDDAASAAKLLFTMHPFRSAMRLLKIPGSIWTDGSRLLGGFEGSSKLPRE